MKQQSSEIGSTHSLDHFVLFCTMCSSQHEKVTAEETAQMRLQALWSGKVWPGVMPRLPSILLFLSLSAPVDPALFFFCHLFSIYRAPCHGIWWWYRVQVTGWDSLKTGRGPDFILMFRSCTLSINFEVTQPCWTQMWVEVYSSSWLDGASTIVLYNGSINANKGALLCEKQEYPSLGFLVPV